MPSEVKERTAANVISFWDLFRGFVQSLCKMVGDKRGALKGLRSGGPVYLTT